MAVRRPIVRVAGQNRQLPPGDGIAGIPTFIPVFRGGVAFKVALALHNMALPVTTKSGATLYVGVNFNG